MPSSDDGFVKATIIRVGVESVLRKMPARPGSETTHHLISLCYALRMADRIDSGEMPAMHWFFFQSAMRAIKDVEIWCDDTSKDTLD